MIPSILLKIKKLNFQKKYMATILPVPIILIASVSLPEGRFAAASDPLKTAFSGSEHISIRPFQNYTPSAGETLDDIRKKFGVNGETIIWSNNLSGQARFDGKTSILLPPTSGLVYLPLAGENWESIATKFGIEKNELIKWNIAGINPGNNLIIPGISYPIHPLTEQKNKGKLPAKNLKQIPGRVVKKGAPFVGGWCTSWVYLMGGQHIPWRGDAKHWIKRAGENGWAISKDVKIGAIYAEPWYSPWGHVSLVVATNPDGSFIVSEMPTFGLGNPSYRIVPNVDPRATFIYYPGIALSS